MRGLACRCVGKLGPRFLPNERCYMARYAIKTEFLLGAPGQRRQCRNPVFGAYARLAAKFWLTSSALRARL